ncbi:MAG TPA: tyrosine-type recombinase/integrase [Candidatus Limnocylindrales bacterium]|nr:tyrosine-type recombinase/integrase [Candidatus Limnocylindrales bacterium]
MNKLHIEALLEEYLVSFSAEKNLSPMTVKLKKQILKTFNQFCQSSSKPFGASLCRDYCTYMFQNGWVADESKLNVVKVLRAFINFLYKRKYITENFAQELERPKLHRKILDLVSEEELEKIIIAGTTPGKGDGPRSTRIKAEMRDALFFLALTGLRVSEMIGLKRDDLRLQDDPPSFVIKSKGGNFDLMECPRNAYDLLKARENNPRTFEVTEEALREALKRGCKNLGIKKRVRPHTLRNIFSVSRLRKQEPLQKVSRLLRHKSVAVTDRYYSHYALSDLSHALNNTKILQSGLPVEIVVDDLEKEIRKNVDSRLSLEVKRQKQELVIKVRW